MDRLAEIKKLYYNATPRTIQHDLARAIDLLKEMSGEEERERAAVYMDGLAQMRSEWAAATRSRTAPPRARRPGRPDKA
jgi:hypothetical protein